MVNRRYDQGACKLFFMMGNIQAHCRKIWVILLAVCLLPCCISLAQPSMRSEITPTSGHKDDLFLFTVTVEGYQERVSPQLSAGGDFDVQFLGPKTSVSIINGQVYSRQQFIYQLIPKKEGSLKTPEVQAILDGQAISAAPISITIKSSSNSPPLPSPGNGEQIFMRQTISPEQAYVGQQIVNAITVYTRVNLRGVRIDDEAADGFWQENISEGNNSQRTVNGIDYGSAQILRALFALKSGNLLLPARKALVQIPVLKRTNPLGNIDPFTDDFFANFFKKTVIQEKTLTSNDVPISISPLPPIPNELKDFTRGLPIVGDTSINVQISEAPMQLGESRNLSIIITSSGHLNPVKPPSLTAPAGVKIYDGQTTTKHDTSGSLLVTQKIFNYSIVPTQPGFIRIPGVSITYFDTTSKDYKLATSSDIPLVVSGTLPATQNSISASGVGTTPLPGPQSSLQDPPSSYQPEQVTRGVYIDRTLWDSISERISIQLALLLLAASLLLATLSAFYLRRASPATQRRALLHQLAQSTTLEELEQGIRSWAAVSLPGLRDGATFDEMRALISTNSRDKSAILSLISALDNLEVARYAGETSLSLESVKPALIEAIKTWR